MTQFMCKHTGQFIFVPGQRHDLWGYVHAATCHIESIRVREVDEIKLKVKLGGGHVLQKTIGNLAEIPGQLFVGGNAIVMLHMLGHGIAKVLFLLLAKDVCSVPAGGKVRRYTALLSFDRNNPRHRQEQHHKDRAPATVQA
jgi:hypothetical protein